MKYKVSFRIRNRFGKGSVYDLRDIAICLVDRFSLTTHELEMIVTLSKGSTFFNEDLHIKRLS